MKRTTFLLVALLLLAAGARPLRAEREVGLKYVTYSDNNRVKVATEGIDLSVDVGPKTKLTMSRVVDGITAASRQIPIIDGVSGATARTATDRTEYRKELGLGLTRKIGNNTLSVSGNSSAEDDYSSLAGFLSWTSEFNNRNNAVTLAYSDYRDRLFPFGVEWTDIKTSRIFDLALTSVLTPRSQVRAVASYARDDGYLSNPYHRIVIDDYYYRERHPSVRDKAALGLFYVLGGEGKRVSSVQFDYRYYIDSWDVRSHTGGAKYTRHLTDGLMGFLRVRYYTQGAASFYRNGYTQEERFMTADPKLGAFSAVLGGAGFTLELLPGLSFDLMYEQYAHASGIDYARVYQSVARSDLVSQIIYLGTRIKL